MRKKFFQNSFKIFFIIILIFSLSSFIFIVYQNKYKKINNTFIKNEPSFSKLSKKDYKYLVQETNLRLMFFGDIFFGRYIDDWSQENTLKYKYPFSGLNTFNDKKNYDAWIANLECPVTERYIPSATQENLLKFSCQPDYLPEAKKWFDILGLANNHTDNMNEIDGFEKTKKYLDQNKFQYFGHYDNSAYNNICEIVTIKNKQGFNIPIALCGYHNVFKLPDEESINEISKYSKHFFTIAVPHQGKEYELTSDELKRSTYRKMIDAGADAVIGGHPHVIQELENYNDKLIVYSVGNFIFDQQRGETPYGLGVDINITFENNENFKLLEELGPKCFNNKDDCLFEAEKLSIKKPEFSINYNLVVSDDSNHLTKKATTEKTKNVLNRIGWNEVNINK